MVFKNPWLLTLIPLVLPVVYLYSRRMTPSTFRFSSHRLVQSVGASFKMRLLFLPFLLRALAIGLFLFALAGPRFVSEETVRKTEGIDIVLTIDASGSMAAEDFKINGKRVNRLKIVKKVVSEFIDQRENDRLGLITFAALAYTVTPLTTDYSWLLENLERVRLGLIQDGTAIGSAIMSSVARLRDSDAKSKVVILLTDGVNNGREVNPIEAARVAKSFGIKVYTIGAGTDGYVPFPMRAFGQRIYRDVKINIDEDVLKEVAYTTGAKYFRATDAEKLKAIYDEIDQLEKTEVEEFGYFEYTELFAWFLGAGLLLLLLEIILKNTYLLRVP